MKQSIQYRILGLIILLCSSLSAIAQVKIEAGGETVQLDTLTKIIGVLLTIGGFFMGYMQMKMATKIAEQEAKFFLAMKILEDKLQAEIKLSAKEIELGMRSMATHHDIKNLQTVMGLQHEITIEKTKSIEKQLELAAELFKK